ncbi:MAG: 3-phosphoglycerate dehydrogenase [Lentisphaerota bacterium]
MKKVLIPTKLDAVAKSLLEGHGKYTVVQEEKVDLLEMAGRHPDAYAIVVRSEKVTAEVMDALPSLKVVIRAGAGYDNINIKHARKKGIDVMNTPGANSNAVAEEVVALMLADARHLIEADGSCRKGEWEKTKFMGREITSKTIGVVGLGYIGQLVARRLSGFDMHLLGYDPFISQEKAKQMDVELVDLPTLFERSDYISLHIPENADTKGLINTSLLSKMKKGATLVNCARAGVINENDLRAIKPEKGIRFLNDVYPKDEAGPKSVADIADIMVPHLGASTKEANANAARLAANELMDYDDKGIMSCVVNRDIPEGLDKAYCDLAFTLSKLCRHVLGKEAKLKLVETSFYGTLKPFANWLIVPVAAALSDSLDRSSDSKAARQLLKDMGIDYADREPDGKKKYESSITVDLIGNVSDDHLRRASIRGTVAEGILMISRINDFDKLYFEPLGHTVFFAYDDRPGVLGRIGAALAAAGINIDDVRNPHDSKGEQSLAFLKVNKAVPDSVIQSVAKDIQAHTAFYAEFA